MHACVAVHVFVHAHKHVRAATLGMLGRARGEATPGGVAGGRQHGRRGVGHGQGGARRRLRAAAVLQRVLAVPA